MSDNYILDYYLCFVKPFLEIFVKGKGGKLMIYDNVRALCKSRHTSIFALEKALGFGNGTIGGWRISSPTVEKLTAVAQFFGVSLDELIKENEGDDRNS